MTKPDLSRTHTPTPFALALGARIAALREAAGLTRYQLAAVVGVSPPRVYEWESGDRSPTGEYLAVITLALGVSFAELDGTRGAARVRPKKEKSEIPRSAE